MSRFARSIGPMWGLMLVGVFVMLGCGGGDSAGTSETADSGDPAVAVESGDASSGEPVAMVNGKPISKGDLDRVLDNMRNSNIPPDDSVDGDTPEEQLRNTALKVLIEQSVIVQAAAEEGVTVEDGAVQQQLNNIKLRSGGDEQFQQALAAAGATEADLLRDLKDNMVIREYFSQKINQAPEVTDAELREFYEENADRYGPRPEVHAQHILLRTAPGLDEFEKAEVIGRAHEIIKKIEGGADFAAVAAEFSEDETTAQSGGELGWFGRGRMVAPFDSAAFALKAGEISGPVETQFGVHVLQVSETRNAPARPFDEVRDELYQGAVQKKMVDANQALVDDLKAKADIEVLTS